MLQLHHLVNSRSSRIIWLLEALGTEYQLVTHQRGPDRRSQASLAAVHSLGKAPVIVDGGLMLVESATILRYIDDRHGNGRFMPPAGSSDRAVHDQWLDYAESSFMPPLMTRLMGLLGGGLPPTLDGFATAEFDKALAYVGTGVTHGGYLGGDTLTLADMQMSFCLALAEAGGFLQGCPDVASYWQRLQGEPGFRRMIEVGGPLVALSR